MKIINYFLQSVIIYIFFFFGRIVGLKNGRKIFAFLFSLVGPLFKSRQVIDNNLNIFLARVPNRNKKEIVNNMWKNYGMTFIEYIFLSDLRTSIEFQYLMVYRMVYRSYVIFNDVVQGLII